MSLDERLQLYREGKLTREEMENLLTSMYSPEELATMQDEEMVDKYHMAISETEDADWYYETYYTGPF